MKPALFSAIAILVMSVAPAHAGDGQHQGTVKIAQAAYPLAEGEVRKVDKEAKKITLRHGAIEKLKMPAMTMVFQVKDPAMLDGIQAGDKVRFQADKVDGQYFVTQIEAAR
jgi:Cu(I)/Ag(I) efflux system periplasmic protein CusF